MITETTIEDAVLDVLREHAAALHDGDDARLRALSTPDVVRADLAPPLVQPNLPRPSPPRACRPGSRRSRAR